MAKVTITIEDCERGKAAVSIAFDPPYEEGSQPTDAQLTAMRISNGMNWVGTPSVQFAPDPHDMPGDGGPVG